MFKNRLKELEKRVKSSLTEPSEKACNYYQISNKKSRREIYFKNNGPAINFIREKFKYSFLKRFVYLLIKLHILQPFLKKIKLTPLFGDAIYIANSIKCFDLIDKTVIVFPLRDTDTKEFLELISLHHIIGNLKPSVLEVNKKIPFYKEELLSERFKGDLIIPLRLLKEFNTKTGYIHGSFMEDHIYKKGDSCVFLDWENIRKGDYEEDIRYYINLVKDRAIKGGYKRKK